MGKKVVSEIPAKKSNKSLVIKDFPGFILHGYFSWFWFQTPGKNTEEHKLNRY